MVAAVMMAKLEVAFDCELARSNALATTTLSSGFGCNDYWFGRQRRKRKAEAEEQAEVEDNSGEEEGNMNQKGISSILIRLTLHYQLHHQIVLA